MMSNRKNAILLAVVFAAATVGFVLLHRQFAFDQAIRDQEAHNVVLARALANAVWPKFAEHVRTATPAEIENLRGGTATAALGREIAAFVGGTPVHRVKVYNTAGLTVFSSNPGQIGEDRANYPGFRHAMDKKEPFSTLEFRDSFTGFAKTHASIHLIASYIPIEGKDGAIEGVFELYTGADAALARVRESTIRFGAVVAAAMAALYGALAWMLGRRRG